MLANDEAVTDWYSNSSHIKILCFRIDRTEQKIEIDVSILNTAFEKVFFLFTEDGSFPFYYEPAVRGIMGFAEWRGQSDGRDLFHLEFSEYAKKNLRSMRSPWDLRNGFSLELGSVEVFRALNLTEDELNGITNLNSPGIYSKYVIDNPHQRLGDIRHLYLVHFASLPGEHTLYNDRRDYAGNLLMSASNYPDIAVFAGNRFRESKPGSNLYLFRLRIPRLDLLQPSPESPFMRPVNIGAGIAHQGQNYNWGDTLEFVDWRGHEQRRKLDERFESFILGVVHRNEILDWERVQ